MSHSSSSGTNSINKDLNPFASESSSSKSKPGNSPPPKPSVVVYNIEADHDEVHDHLRRVTNGTLDHACSDPTSKTSKPQTIPEPKDVFHTTPNPKLNMKKKDSNLSTGTAESSEEGSSHSGWDKAWKHVETAYDQADMMVNGDVVHNPEVRMDELAPLQEKYEAHMRGMAVIYNALRKARREKRRFETG